MKRDLPWLCSLGKFLEQTSDIEIEVVDFIVCVCVRERESGFMHTNVKS